ncbi:hypothetical protein T4D_11003 [Trichinella pseudospiralis]|uniref:Uncharacterized protein n=1 Tax=Trichinella pseudospiralis TaxID=6337 RepID=A0A0V1G5X4_TRIPS|nr:hypothetical protein T4D_11003 [Trichinella pseudospiralis]
MHEEEVSPSNKGINPVSQQFEKSKIIIKKTLYPLCFGSVSQSFITTSAAKKPIEFSTFGAIPSHIQKSWTNPFLPHLAITFKPHLSGFLGL